MLVHVSADVESFRIEPSLAPHATQVDAFNSVACQQFPANISAISPHTLFVLLSYHSKDQTKAYWRAK
jgi:hypothetical protein